MEAPPVGVPEPNQVRKVLKRVGFMMMAVSAAHLVQDSNDPSVSKVHLFSFYTLGVLGSGLFLLSMGRPQAPARLARILSSVGLTSLLP